MSGNSHDQELVEQNLGDMKVAIPVANGKLCNHFAHCDQFAFITVINGAITKRELFPPPSQGADILPTWLSDLGCTDFFVAGMNVNAQETFRRHGVQVTSGVPSDTPDNIVDKCLCGQLIITGCISDHGQEGHGCCHH